MKLKWDTKLGEESTCCFEIGVRNLTNFDLSAQKFSKSFILMGSFWAKYILSELKKCRGIIFHETEEGYKTRRGIELSFQSWHKKFDKFWPKHSKILKNFHFNGLLRSKVYIVWDKEVQRSNLSWQWRGIQNLVNNQLVV